MGQRLEGRRSAGPSPGVIEEIPFRRRQTRRAVVFRTLASGGGVIALPQRLRRAGGACAPSRNGRVSPSTLAGPLARRRSPGAQAQRPDPALSLPSLTRSQALRALRATGRGETAMASSRGGEVGSGNGGGIERAGEFEGSHRNTCLLPNAVGEVARRRSRRDGGVLEGEHAAKNPSTTFGGPPPHQGWGGDLGLPLLRVQPADGVGVAGAEVGVVGV